MKIFDVYTAAIRGKEDGENEVVLGLFDNRYNSVMIIRPKVIQKPEGEATGAEFDISEPDGAERLYWLDKFGMITEEEFQVEAAKLQPQNQREKLYNLLKKEFSG